VAYTEKCMMR